MKNFLILATFATTNALALNSGTFNYPKDIDNDCQNTKAEVLIAKSQVPVAFAQQPNGKNCIVKSGQWTEYYTGKTVYDASEVLVHHIVPLTIAERDGAMEWTQEKREEFANDTENLVVAFSDVELSVRTNNDISKYMPQNVKIKCDFLGKYIAIKQKYNLNISDAEKNVIAENQNCVK